MKFYNSIGPNPRMVRMFMAEKGIELHKVAIDLANAAAWYERMRARPNAAL